jgi:D-methionine transport system permease protein
VNGWFDGFLDSADVFRTAIGQTLLMAGISLVVSGVLGLLMGIALYATRPGNVFGNRWVFGSIGFVVNLVRPIPFVIFIAAIGPLQKAVVGSTIGTNAVTFGVALAAAFAVARIVEQSLVEIDAGSGTFRLNSDGEVTDHQSYERFEMHTDVYEVVCP